MCPTGWPEWLPTEWQLWIGEFMILIICGIPFWPEGWPHEMISTPPPIPTISIVEPVAPVEMPESEAPQIILDELDEIFEEATPSPVFWSPIPTPTRTWER